MRLVVSFFDLFHTASWALVFQLVAGGTAHALQQEAATIGEMM